MDSPAARSQACQGLWAKGTSGHAAAPTQHQDLAASPTAAQLDAVLDWTETALAVTADAVCAATQIAKEAGPHSRATDHALAVAEAALAATMQQLSRAQWLVAQRLAAQQQQMLHGAINECTDEELRDTCSSSISSSH